MTQSTDAAAKHFDGVTYDPSLDHNRLSRQLGRAWQAAYGYRFQTLAELAQRMGDPEASVSARLRDLRKPRFGAWIVESRRRGNAKRGIWEYRVLDPLPADLPLFRGVKT